MRKLAPFRSCDALPPPPPTKADLATERRPNRVYKHRVRHTDKPAIKITISSTEELKLIKKDYTHIEFSVH